MTDRIHINHEKAGEDAACVENAAAYLENVPLVPQDMRTTLPANAGSQSAYGRSQERIAGLGVLLDQEAAHIRGLSVAFAEFDRMLGGFAKNGSRHPVITARR